MLSGPPWLKRLQERFLRFWRTDNPRMAVVRDVLVAGVIVGVLLLAIWIYAGQPISQAPVVSVESGSMMHGPFTSGDPRHPTQWNKPSFGRVGTIDPGDIVFVKRVRAVDEVEVAFGPDDRTGYGGPGDVVVFRPDGFAHKTRVIHRALLYVEMVPDGCTPNVDCVYRIPAVCSNPAFDEWSGGQNLDEYCEGSPNPIRLNLRREGVFLDLSDYPCSQGAGSACPPAFSGFITKGDNNLLADQASTISRTVRLDWIIGKARGEIPWFGLIKLAIYGNPTYNSNTDPTLGENWKFLNANAPWDVWTCLFLSLAVLIGAPMAIDYVSNARAKRRAPPESPPPPEP